MKNQQKRKDQIAAGVYDGRFKTKIIVDKKKKARKNWARKNK